MRYVIRTLLGAGLFAFCWVLIAYGLYQLLQVGTCASGGPYVIGRECPGGIERLMFALMGGIFLLFVAAFIYGGRGSPPGSSRPETGTVFVFFWTGLFWSLAVGGFLGAWGPDANPGPGGKEGGLIVAFMGLFMGAGGLVFVHPKYRKHERKKTRPLTTRAAQAASVFTPVADPVDRLEKLEQLRSQGALTRSEFDTLKAKIIKGRD
jgi:hypothetical protein